MTQFFQSIMGRAFYDGTVPRLVKALERIATQLEAMGGDDVALSSQDRWEDDSIQFPRMLAELQGVGLTALQYKQLKGTMDLESVEVDHILERADNVWQKQKASV